MMNTIYSQLFNLSQSDSDQRSGVEEEIQECLEDGRLDLKDVSRFYSKFVRESLEYIKVYSDDSFTTKASMYFDSDFNTKISFAVLFLPEPPESKIDRVKLMGEKLESFTRENNIENVISLLIVNDKKFNPRRLHHM